MCHRKIQLVFYRFLALKSHKIRKARQRKPIAFQSVISPQAYQTGLDIYGQTNAL